MYFEKIERKKGRWTNFFVTLRYNTFLGPNGPRYLWRINSTYHIYI